MADFIKLVDVHPIAPDEPADAPDEEAACKFESKPTKSDVYEGPYPLKSLKRIRKLFIDGIFGYGEASGSANQERMVEILKLKLKIKSRLDGNQAAIRQIERETAQFKELIEKRMDFMEKRLGTRREVVRYFNATSNSSSITTVTRSQPPKTSRETNDSDSTVEIETQKIAKTDEASLKTLPFFINKKDISSATNQKSTPETSFLARRSDGTKGNEIIIESSDSDDEDDDDDSITVTNGDDEDVQLLQEIHSYFKETDNILEKFQESDHSNDETDSRCYQFSMYKYDSKNPENAGKIVTKFPKQTSTTTSAGKDATVLEDELEEKTKQYRELRNKRNKERRQQSKSDADEGEKSQLAIGLRKIRADIKKLRRKRNKNLFKSASK